MHLSTFYIDHIDYEKPKKSKKDKKKRNTKVFSDEESGEDERRIKKSKKDSTGTLDFMKYYKDNVFQNDPLHKQPDQLLKIKNQLHVQA